MASSAQITTSPFSTLPQIDPNDYYAEVIQKARSETTTHYASYLTSFEEMKPLIETWKSRHYQILRGELAKQPNPEELTQELNEKVNAYIGYRKIREDIKRIQSVYTHAINRCNPPSLDAPTIIELKKIGCDIAGMQKQYEQVFTTSVNELKDEAQKIDQLYKDFFPILSGLRESLEILAAYQQGYDNSSINRVAYGARQAREMSTTPCVNRLVRTKASGFAENI
jgi:hypothetical protein